MEKVIVVGAGVSGLTCAVRLLESGFDVTVLTREPWSETTSSVAAALWFPFRAYPLEKVIGWSFESLKRFDQLEQDAGSGVRTSAVKEVYRQELPSPRWRTRLRGFRELDRDEIPDAFAGGYAMEAPVVDSSRYLPFLVRWIERLGGGIEAREVEDLASLRSETRLVVNCSGTGARSLVGDESVFPIRGQIVRVPLEPFDGVIVDEESAQAAYVVPRTSDCILGTTVEENQWDRTPSMDDTRAIIERCELLDGRVRGVEVLDARVGLRPGRPEVRLEVEHLDEMTVVHDYGHGGSGFTLSWGCAEGVLSLLGPHSLHRTR